MNRLGQEGLAWVPTLGNILTLLCFGLCLWVSTRFTEVGSRSRIPTPPHPIPSLRVVTPCCVAPWELGNSKGALATG